MLEYVEVILNSYLLVIIFDLILQCHSADIIIVVVVVFIVVPLFFFFFFFGSKRITFWVMRFWFTIAGFGNSD